MYSVVFLAVAAFVLSLAFTPLVRWTAARTGLMDAPDFGRKLHQRPIARIGGAAVALSYVVAFGIFLLSPFQGAAFVRENDSLVQSLLPAAALVFAAGLLDDVAGLRPLYKLTGQIIAACLVYHSGVRIAIGSSEGVASFLATVAWIVLCTNAFNLIDGMDGLAAGLGFLAAVPIFVVAVVHESVPLALATAPLAGALLGFLKYNFSPASIFLGDSGSQLIGFMLGCFGIVWSHKTATGLGMAAPLMALAIPLIDTCLAVVRRFASNQPIMMADKRHIHHLLMDHGLTPRRTAVLLYGLALVAAAFALVHDVFLSQYSGFVLGAFCIVAAAGVYHLGLAELVAVRKVFTQGRFRRMLSAQTELELIEQKLRSAGTFNERWSIIRLGAVQFGFVRIRARVAWTDLDAEFEQTDTSITSVLRIPLQENGFVEFHHRQEGIVADHAPFVDLVCRHLARRERSPQGQRWLTAGASGQTPGSTKEG